MLQEDFSLLSLCRSLLLGLSLERQLVWKPVSGSDLCSEINPFNETKRDSGIMQTQRGTNMNEGPTFVSGSNLCNGSPNLATCPNIPKIQIFPIFPHVPNISKYSKILRNTKKQRKSNTNTNNNRCAELCCWLSDQIKMHNLRHDVRHDGAMYVMMSDQVMMPPARLPTDHRLRLPL